MKDTDLPSDGIVESSKVVQAQSGEVEPVILQASDRGEDTLAVNNCRENMYQLSQVSALVSVLSSARYRVLCKMWTSAVTTSFYI